MADDEQRMPPAELVAEARRVPSGWVYEIAPGVDPDGEVAPEQIIGAWSVSPSGELTGEYTPNPRYVAPRDPDDVPSDDPGLTAL